MERYTGREIAIFTDVHGLLYPTIAILSDIKRRGIKEIYSLGDNIGVGPDPSGVLDLLGEYGVKSINGNSEDYSTIGIEPFKSYFGPTKIESQEWTYSQLSSEQIKQLNDNKHSYDLVVGGMKIGLCHFGNDVRIDFGKNSTWSYQRSINYHLPNPQQQFYYTNSEDQKKNIDEKSKIIIPENAGFLSAKNDPIFGGKTVDYYDEIIQGHVHFKFLTEDENVRIRTIRAAGMAYGNDPIDYASYIVIKEKEIGYDVEEILVPFDRDKMLKSIDDSSMPNKDTINKFVSRKWSNKIAFYTRLANNKIYQLGS